MGDDVDGCGVRDDGGDGVVSEVDLVVWLTAQLDQDEQLARTVADRYVDVRDGRPYWPLPSVEARFRDAQPAIRAGLDLIKLYDPARVLRGVAAHREMLAAVASWADPHPGRPCDDDDSNEPCQLHVAAGRRLPPYVLHILASIYADRPGYDPSWTVE